MTPDQITPDRGGLYRHRENGWVLRLANYQNGTRNRVRLVCHGFGSKGCHGPREWWGSTQEFWANWIHASATNEP